MDAQGTRLESLYQIGEELIRDADYHNSTAKAIWDQLEDFDECWKAISNSVKERKAVVSIESKTRRNLPLRFLCSAYILSLCFSLSK